jgi:tRNA(Ile)-lysidine synthase
MTSLAGRVLATIRRRSLFPDGARVLAAVSGGPDSVALTRVLAELSAAGVLRLAGIAHLNHCLRGAASERDAEFCRRLAADRGLPFDVERCDVAAIAARPGRSIEEAAREARYAFLERARIRLGADVVAVGHTRDDQAETVLLRLLRGAGSGGLRGIHPRRGTIVRPLIDQRRQALMEYLEGLGERWVEDESNEDRAHRRNRLRHDVLPLLLAAEGASVVDVLARTADLASADEALLAALTAQARARLVVDGADGAGLDPEAFAREPLALRRRILRGLLQEATRRAPSFQQVEGALRFVERGQAGALALSGCRVELSPGVRVLFSRAQSGRDTPGFASWVYSLAIPGELLVPEAGLRLRAHVDAGEPPGGPTGPAERCRAHVDSPAVGPNLVVRAWHPGDRVRLADGSGRKKVQDLFVDCKVPRAERHRIPILESMDGRIVWVAGHAVGGDFRVTRATKSVVVLSFEPLGGL